MKQRNKDLAESAKLDKQQVLIEKFVENTQDKHKKHMWKAVKELKKNYTAIRQNEEQNGHACAFNKKG